MNEENNQREKKVLNFLKGKFNWIVYFLLAIIIWVNIKIRTLPMAINSITGKPGLWDITRNNWTLGPDLDPFFFLRWAKMIVEQGALPLIDTMRYVPIGYNTQLETKLLPYLIAYFYKFLHFFSDKVTIEYAAVVLPVVASIFIVIAFFLFVRKIFEEKGMNTSNIIALVASAFLITLPSLLGRTVAGIPEKESIGFALMFFAFYFFLFAWKSEGKKSFVLGCIAGIFTALMGLIWGGVMFVFISIAIAGFINLIFGKVDKKSLIVYSSWLFCAIIFWIPLTLRTGFREFLISSSGGSAIIIWFFMFTYFIMFKTNLKNIKILQNKIPKIIQSIIVSLLIVFVLSSIVLGPKTLINMGGDILSKLSSPYTARIAFTVAENKQPFFSDWRANFGPSFGHIPLFFWLFFVGSVCLFYEMIKKLNVREKIILISGYVLFLITLIFSRYSSASILNGSSGLSLVIYVLGFVILGGCVGYTFYKRYKKEEFSIFKKVKFEYILVFSLIFVGIIAGRSAIRLIMLLSTIAVIPLSYLFVISIKNAFKEKKELGRLFSVVFVILLLVVVPYTLFYNYQSIKIAAEYHVPTSYTWQWQEAMGWVRDNTSPDAVFGSWWDYGYWIQTMGERATMLDGGNNIGYWNYLMGRHVLTADNESEALELLYNHNVTHFLIDSTEVGKYSAYSNIGSDEDYDKFSWISTFLIDETQTIEEKNKTTFIYPGGAVLDEDLVINMNGEEIFLPSQKAGVIGILLSVKENNKFEQPQVAFYYNDNQYRVNLRYLFINGQLIDFDSGVEGCAYIFPLLDKGKINPIGASLFLSPRNMRALWVKMYLLGQGENFELVHMESSKVVESLRDQGINIPEFVYYGGFNGPIKIWEVNYIGDEKNNEEYVQRKYPDRIASRRDV